MILWSSVFLQANELFTRRVRDSSPAERPCSAYPNLSERNVVTRSLKARSRTASQRSYLTSSALGPTRLPKVEDVRQVHVQKAHSVHTHPPPSLDIMIRRAKRATSSGSPLKMLLNSSRRTCPTGSPSSGQKSLSACNGLEFPKTR